MRPTSQISLALVAFIALTVSKTRGDLDGSVATLARQLMLQQLYVEEKTRSEGDSGLKAVRLNKIGSRPYQAASYISASKVAAIHNHDNNIRTVGMGEFVGVLNGVEFRTRHNDYRLYMPSTTSSEYHRTEEIPFPRVPPEVEQHTDINDQITEMKEWFKAFKTQNVTHRDYRPYFKPILCYLEGAWTTSTDTLNESFESDRHFIDAESWHDLQEKIRYTSYTGGKDNNENFAYLPTTIIDIVNDTIPLLAQWNYRIMCHPLQKEVPLNRLRVIDDLASRMASGSNIYEYEQSRAARFELNPSDSDEWDTSASHHHFLDRLMEEIPGKDNYLADIRTDSKGAMVYPLNSDDDTVPLNLGYYNRAHRITSRDAMGLSFRRRGFNDRNVFMAMTTNEEVAPISIEQCRGRNRRRRCETYTERWTWAIPLELIYLTPLSSWNPYFLEYKGIKSSDEGKTVTADGRNGGPTVRRAFNGTNSKIYYITPSEFFSGGEIATDAADTSQGARGVLDPSGVVRSVRSAGVRIFLPNIPDVGIIRQRYPIMPIYGDGNSIYKELEALKDIVLDPGKYSHMFRSHSTGGSATQSFSLKLGMSNPRRGGAHEHWIDLTSSEMQTLISGVRLTKTTSEENGHSHEVEIQYRRRPAGAQYIMVTCSGRRKCPDGHPKLLTVDNVGRPDEFNPDADETIEENEEE